MLRPIPLLRAAALRAVALCALPLSALSCVPLDAQETPAPAPLAGGLHTEFGARGLLQLSYNGATLLDVSQNGGEAFSIGDIKVKEADGKVHDLKSAPPRRSWDGARKTLVFDYDWGRVSCHYKPQNDRLDLDITLENRSTQTLAGANIFPLALHFGGFPSGYDGTTPHVGFGSDGPTVERADFGAGTLAVVNRDVQQTLAVGLLTSNDTARSFRYSLYVGSAPLWYQPDNWPRFTRPIAPGARDTYQISLRFAPPRTGDYELASDVYERFAAAHPMQLNWKDRRPIGALFLSSAPPHVGGNPRGWFNNAPDVDVTTPAGRADFRARVLEYADQSIRVLQRTGAQGMVTWDIEGQEFPHATSYIGDPRLLPVLAPEMEPVADAYFKKFTAAGFKVGICIRPQQLENGQQRAVAGEAAQLLAKIDYARARWGCTLFYVDSNGGPFDPSDASVFARVAAARPAVLLMPEHQNFKYQAYSAPYNDLRFERAVTPTAVRRTYPRAFSVIRGESQTQQQHSALVQAVRAGDVLMFPAWYNNDEAAEVASIYDEARSKN